MGKRRKEESDCRCRTAQAEMAAPPVALAVIGVDDRPLYLEIAQEGGEENLGLHFVLHCALDFVDEKRT